MTEVGLVLFAVFLLVLIGLDVAMLVSLVRPGDERRKMIVWKASTWTLLGTVGGMVVEIAEALIRGHKAVWCWTGETRNRARRKETGLSQEELARLCGVSRQTINAIENNKYDPTLSLAFHLARELDTTVDELFTP